MNAVLYTEDLEPITVVRISEFLWGRLRMGEQVRLAVPVELKLAQCHSTAMREQFKTVTIYGELLRRRGHEHLMLFTTDEENALALKAEFLPGQNGTMQRRERSAFVRGFLEALMGNE